MAVATGFRFAAGLIRADDLYLVPDPIRRKINPAAVSARLDPLFKHFFTVYLEFDLSVGSVRDGFFVIFGILIASVTFFVWHGVWPHIRMQISKT